MPKLLEQGIIARESKPVRIARQLGHDMRLARKSRSVRAMQEVQDNWQEAVCDREVQENFSIRECFRECVDDGRELIEYLATPRSFQTYQRLMETGAVTTRDFSDFTHAVLSQRVLDAWNNPMFIGGELVQTISSNLRTERIPGISGIGDEAQEVGEGEAYPQAGVSSDYIDTPYTKKHGLKISATREAVFFDRTSLLLNRCDQVGTSLGLRKEKRILAVVLGITNNWRPKDSHLNTATYQTGAGGDAFDNVDASNPLVNWTSISTCRLGFRKYKDPRTGEPIVLGADRVMLGPDALTDTAMKIISAERVRDEPAAASGGVAIDYANPARGNRWLTNELVADILGSETTWFYGAPKQAFGYIENWPIEVIRAPANSYREWENDIVFEAKASEMGTPCVIQPRFMRKNT